MKSSLLRADAAQECNDGGMVIVDGDFEGSPTVPESQRVGLQTKIEVRKAIGRPFKNSNQS